MKHHSSSSAIVATNLMIKKDGNEIIAIDTLHVKKGTITGLIGPSGSGKTTLMRAIVGVQKYQGSLIVFGKPAGDTQLRAKIGYVTQAPAVYGDLTVVQNLRYFATITGASRNQVEQIIHSVELQMQRTQRVMSLSGGQRARVSLAIALLGNPEILVLDEPTVGLDPVLREELWTLFGKLADSGKTLVVSSHVMDEAARCQELLLLRGGKLLWNDQPQALLRQTHTSDVGAAFIAMIKETD